MSRIRFDIMGKTALRAVCAAAMLTGAMAAQPALAGDGERSGKGAAARQDDDADRAVRLAEKSVADAPRDGALRAALGQAYLRAGRLASARAALSDAMQLGEDSPRIALMLALAEIGAGSPRHASMLLAQQGNLIPAADRGLAFALAGETSRGVEIISADIRAGNDNPKTRQNLAYAYALDGRWREARMMASQDVPADVLDRRMTEWAMNARPEQAAARVAALVGATLQADSGMPTQLALANFPAAAPVAKPAAPASKIVTPAPRLAAAPAAKPAQAAVPAVKTAQAAPPAVKAAPVASPAAQPVATPAAKPVVAPVVVARAELPPVAASAPVAAPVQANPAKSEIKLAAVPASTASGPAMVRNAVVQQAPAAPVPATVTPAALTTTKAPVAKAPAAKVAAKPALAKLAAAKPALPAPSASGTHIAQLGSYGSMADARAGWKVLQSRYANLKGQQPVITQAKVDGKDYWRVAAGSFDAAGAKAMCQAVKANGGGCLPIASAARADGKVRIAKAD
ncbi:tetratricopeptide repeat protein [Croceicoccus sp. BE223]|uniref:tetratricopeptide repeat protein n=1 Tax=Croceicoccus sp. BE223 TaxID=2817716 RepID=UPI00285496C0|nr:tetratricopeptide repeat protein [Croceicoccus sp. BE223]MDR7102749.1 Flp pilus assembly protein TadD [Croceicoccus sp. BE223]